VILYAIDFKVVVTNHRRPRITGHLKEEKAMRSENLEPIASPVHERRSQLAVRSLDDLLAMALRYHSRDEPRQAEDIFWMLAEDHFDAPQGEVAKSKLTALAHEYERNGCDHEARAIYQRLFAIA
jgi:hypothetical protein